MVQLKVLFERGRRGMFEGKFQFQMVQLKALSCDRERTQGIFQFQMVQLKGRTSRPSSSPSPFQFQMVQLKVYVMLGATTLSFIFQFQMVQLKELCTEYHRLQCKISIPNGSIKRDSTPPRSCQNFIDFNSKWFN